MKATKRSGPTVYGILDRLEDRNWIAGYWEDQNSQSSTPRRRLYRLTDEGRTALLDLVRERRPQALENLHRPTPGSLPPRGSLAPGGAG
jgi:PadR family transcriptional regulator, regulatory protein PadR